MPNRFWRRRDRLDCVIPRDVRNATVVIRDAPSASKSLMTDESEAGRREEEPDTMWLAWVVAVVPRRDMKVVKCMNFMVIIAVI